MPAYYNESDKYAAQWLRNLIAAGYVRAGDVDDRSIADVQPDDLRGYDQCHFFAGIGGWPLALEMAGWGDRPVWTGSCPCQPFSAAGKRRGVEDERHLWPVWAGLIAQCRPSVLFGEQVASRAGRDWLASVRADLEALGYAVGAADLCAAGVGAPHIRQRLWWIGLAEPEHVGRALGGPARVHGDGAPRHHDAGRRAAGGMADARGHGAGQYPRELPGHEGEHALGPADGHHPPLAHGADGGLADGLGAGLERHARHGDGGPQPGRVGAEPDGPASAKGGAGRVADADGTEPQQLAREGARPGGAEGSGPHGQLDGRGAGSGLAGGGWPSPPDSFWGAADWLWCRDAKWRPVEPGTFPLVDGVPQRVGQLRAYGNAIVPQVAAEFIRAMMP